MAVNLITLFDRLGKAFFAIDTLNTARGTTVPTEVQDYMDEFALGLASMADADLQAAIAPVPAGLTNWQSNGDTIASVLVSSAEATLKAMIEDDEPQEGTGLDVYLQELIEQMEASSDDVDASTVSVSVAAGGSNVGDGVLIATTTRGDGATNENILAEILRAKVTTETGNTEGQIEVLGETAATIARSHIWPLGSGSGTSIRAINPAVTGDNKLLNGSFADEDDLANMPDDWTIVDATVGTLLVLTDVEVQQLVVSGSPTGGTYTITVFNTDGDGVATAHIAWDAAQGAVQSAIQALPGFEAVTVASSGASPNFTHVITYTGMRGDLSQLTATSHLTGGTPGLSPSTTTAGSGNVFAGSKALEYDSDGVENTNIAQRIDGLLGRTNYAFNLWMKTDSAPAAGVITISLVDGIGGTVINDEEGTANSLAVDCTALTTSYVAKNAFFRLPRDVPPVVYLEIKITTDVSIGSSIFMDHAALAEATELYPGGLWAAAFSGGTDWEIDDSWNVTATNDLAGEFQTWFDRAFDMRGKGLLLPSDTGGSETIADTKIG